MDDPASAYVYRLFSYDDLLYVGCSVDPKSRLSAHRREQPWGAEIYRMTVDGPYRMRVARENERYAISAERPLYNIYHRDCTIARQQPRTLPDWCYGSYSLRKHYGVN